jgi:hypothetical protein
VSGHVPFPHSVHFHCRSFLMSSVKCKFFLLIDVSVLFAISIYQFK